MSIVILANNMIALQYAIKDASAAKRSPCVWCHPTDFSDAHHIALQRKGG
jgi:hypothetical protein